jgi:hypothetical protein
MIKIKYLHIYIFITITVAALLMSCTQENEVSDVKTPELPVIESFTANPASIDPGQKVELRWNVTGADETRIQPEINSISSTGTFFVSPDSTTTYILNAKNSTGWVTKTVIVEVRTFYSQQNIIGFDPVTGRNSDFFVILEQLCLSSAYQVQIAKDPGFSLMIYDSGIFDPASITAPTFHYQVGGKLEAGHTYFMRYRSRQAVTGQWIRSPWSEIAVFTIQSGLPITSPR